MVYVSLKKKVPHNLAARTRSILKALKYVKRAVTHTAAQLNPEHENLMKEFREKLDAFVTVRTRPAH